MPVTPSPTPWPSGSSPASPPYAGNVISTEWAKQLAETYVAISPLSEIATDISDFIDKTGTVKVPSKPSVSTNVYSEGAQVMFVRPSGPVRTIDLNRADAFSILLDDVLRSQANYDLPAIYREQAMRTIAWDQAVHFISQIISAVPAANKGGSAGVVTSNVNLGTSGTPLPISAIQDAMAAAFNVLDQQNVPASEGRWVLMSFRVAQAARSKFGFNVPRDHFGPGAVVGRWAGATLLVNPALPANRMLVGHKSAIMMAKQVKITSPYDSAHTFAMVIRGLVVSGLAVTSPEGIAQVYIA